MPPDAAPNPLLSLPMFIVPIAIIYFLIIRPQQKSRREHETMVKNLQKHDQVVTSGGVIGTVVNVKPETVTLRVDENVRIEVERQAISRIIKSKAQTSSPEPIPAK